MPLFAVDKLRRRLLRLWVGLGIGVCLLGQLREQRFTILFQPHQILFGFGGEGPDASAVVSPEEWWPTRSYPTTDLIRTGLLSDKPFEFFQRHRDEIDSDDPHQRCERHGFKYRNRTIPRRIFYGAMIANEPWELFEVAGAEAYGLFSGLVFVEGNRTQNFTPRNASRLGHGPHLANIFGVHPANVQVRLYANENASAFQGDVDSYLSREHAQRQEILKGWKELGMQRDDLGYLGDSDEVFTRDYYLALQYCDDTLYLDYERGRCRYNETGMKSSTLNFEGSPDCPTKDRTGYRPDIFVGHCIEEIGDENLHPKAPRPYEGSMDRAVGFGDRQTGSRAGEDSITDGRYPLYNAADMRRIGGAVMAWRKQENYSDYTGYHFHNFFSGAEAIRYKYRTYGHSRETDFRYTLGDLDADIDLMVRCVHNDTAKPTRGGYYEFVVGGLMNMKPPYPVYFLDDDYRRRRHDFVKSMVLADESEWRAHNGESEEEAAAAAAAANREEAEAEEEDDDDDGDDDEGDGGDGDDGDGDEGDGNEGDGNDEGDDNEKEQSS